MAFNSFFADDGSAIEGLLGNLRSLQSLAGLPLGEPGDLPPSGFPFAPPVAIREFGLRPGLAAAAGEDFRGFIPSRAAAPRPPIARAPSPSQNVEQPKPKRKKPPKLSGEAKELWSKFPEEALLYSEVLVAHSFLDSGVDTRDFGDQDSSAARALRGFLPAAGRTTDKPKADEKEKAGKREKPTKVKTKSTATTADLDLLVADNEPVPEAQSDESLRRVAAVLATPGSIVKLDRSLGSFTYLSLAQRRELIVRHVHEVASAVQRAAFEEHEKREQKEQKKGEESKSKKGLRAVDLVLAK